MKMGAILQPIILSGVSLIVFAFGLKATWRDAASLFRRPGPLLRSLFAMYVVMPLFAAGLAAAFPLTPAVKIALLLLSVSPVFPLLPRKLITLGARGSSVYGLFTAVSLLSVALVPLSASVWGRAIGVDTRVAPSAVASIVILTVLAPLGAGMAVRLWAPEGADRAEKPVFVLGAVLVLIGLIPILIESGGGMISLIGNGTLLSLAVFVAVGLATGHLLGGPDPDDRSGLALAAALRHPAVALAVARANFPDETLAPAAILLYLIIGALVVFPYMNWRKRGRLAGAREREGEAVRRYKRSEHRI